jgi:hypothetical protein
MAKKPPQEVILVPKKIASTQEPWGASPESSLCRSDSP